MGDSIRTDPYREKFRPQDDAAIERQVDEVLAGLELNDLYEAEPAGGEAPRQTGSRRGRVMRVTDDDVFVDFGGKSQGIAPRLQFDEPPKVGQELEFDVERYDAGEGLLILRRKGAVTSAMSWEDLEEGQVIEAVVTGTNKGGLELDVKKMRAFMPAGQVDLYHVPDLEQFVGQKLVAEVMKVDPAGRDLVLSRRNVLQRQREEARRKLLEELEEGQIRRGTVRNVMDYGAFVDLGGVDGLLHVSEMSLRRLGHPSEAVKTGDVVDVKIIKFDRETGKLSLSLRQTMADPWADAADKYAPGMPVTGRVTRVEKFGAFIEVEEGLEGLLPVSEMSWQRVRDPSDVAKEGDTLRLVVLSIDPSQRRISFSLKQAGMGEGDEAARSTSSGQEERQSDEQAPPPAKKKKRPQLRGGLDF